VYPQLPPNGQHQPAATPGGPPPVTGQYQPAVGPGGPPPTTAWLVSAPPAGTIPPPKQRATSRLNLALIAVAAALGVALAGTAGAVALNVRSMHNKVSTLDDDIAARKAEQARERDRLTTEFQQANLSGKLDQVRSRTEAAVQALLAWDRGGAGASGIKTVQKARNACETAVIDYDATAARFPVDLLAGLPLRIDLSDSSTSCDRSDG